jgi:UDP-MurNAc hydroxylase
MEMRWINHAGFLLQTAAGTIVADPWLEGPVFNDSWDLLSPTAFTYEEFAGVDYLWFSHGHPDHFNPSNIEKISPEHRSRITVLYQKTRDGGIVKYCKELGFADAVEISGRWHALGPDTQIYVESHGNDSWCCIEDAGRRIVSLNDCLIDADSEIKHVAEMAGNVDALLVQFSYANWVGNPDQTERRRRFARRHLEYIRKVCDVIQPRFVIPMASFVYFSHEENEFMNDTANSVEKAASFLEEIGATPVVLYPDDRWDCESPHRNDSAIARYHRDAATRTSGPFRTSPVVPFEELEKLHEDWKKRLEGFHSRIALRLYELAGRCPPIRVHLWDLKQSVELSLGRFIVSSATREECDISMASNSLKYVFAYDWGASDVRIGGRSHIHDRHLQSDDIGAVTDPMNWIVILGDMKTAGRRLGPYLVTTLAKRLRG